MPTTTSFKPDVRIQCQTGDLGRLFELIPEGKLVQTKNDLQSELARRARLCSTNDATYTEDTPLNILAEIAVRHPDCFVYKPQSVGNDGWIGSAFRLAQRAN